MTIRDRVTIQPGGTIQVHHPELPVGSRAEVIIHVEPEPLASAGGTGRGCSSQPESLLDLISKIHASVPEEEWAKLPEDLSMHLDHYLYGAPKEGED